MKTRVASTPVCLLRVAVSAATRPVSVAWICFVVAANFGIETLKKLQRLLRYC
ncbi:hypothetical protein MKX01_001036 [Papaver californicum]|nr:hypothetical protein MKX01_010166 [Papaver californicum]KAI3997824.1 hypothetical protein MKX01_001036 [Papaver californicum]